MASVASIFVLAGGRRLHRSGRWLAVSGSWPRVPLLDSPTARKEVDRQAVQTSCFRDYLDTTGKGSRPRRVAPAAP